MSRSPAITPICSNRSIRQWCEREFPSGNECRTDPTRDHSPAIRQLRDRPRRPWSGRRDRSDRSPGFPRKEEPMFAGLELTPTAALFSSTRSRQVSVSSRHRPPVPRRRAPRSAGTPERRGLCKHQAPGGAVGLGVPYRSGAWVPRPVRAHIAPPGVRSSAGRDRAQGCAAAPWRRAFCPAEARGDLVPRGGAVRGARRAQAGVSAWGYP